MHIRSYQLGPRVHNFLLSFCKVETRSYQHLDKSLIGRVGSLRIAPRVYTRGCSACGYIPVCSLLKLVSLGQGTVHAIAANNWHSTGVPCYILLISKILLTLIHLLLHRKLMDRKNSSSSAASTPEYSGPRSTPPWEASDLPRVPHMAGSALPLSRAETQALSTSWVIRANSDSLVTHHSSDRNTDSAVSVPSPYPTRIGPGSWSERKPSSPSSSRALSPQPGKQQPLSPAYEAAHDYGTATPHRDVVALPGTMSSRSAPAQAQSSTSKKSSDKRQHKKSSAGSKEFAPLGHRFKSAVKEIFKREPVDDRQFESIGDRHWSED
jgi:hypothetical protein